MLKVVPRVSNGNRNRCFKRPQKGRKKDFMNFFNILLLFFSQLKIKRYICIGKIRGRAATLYDQTRGAYFDAMIYKARV